MLIYRLIPNGMSIDPLKVMTDIIYFITQYRDVLPIALLRDVVSEGEYEWDEPSKSSLSKIEIQRMLDGEYNTCGIVLSSKLCVFFSYDYICHILTSSLYDEEVEAAVSKKISIE